MPPSTRPDSPARRLNHSTTAPLNLAFLLLLVLPAVHLAAQPQSVAGSGGAAPRENRPELRSKPMPEVPDARLNRVLRRYYREALGGEESWRRLDSLRIHGVLKTADGEFSLKVYHKKPNLLKMTLSGPAASVVLGYDGETAWKVLGRGFNGGGAVAMEAAEARRFIFNANFDSYLLYPLAPGKTVEYAGFVPTEGEESHHLRVRLDSGFVIDYFLDVQTCLVLRAETTDTRSGMATAMHYYDYTRVHGIPIAQRVVSIEDGATASELRIDRLEPNIGIASWIFRPPQSAAF